MSKILLKNGKVIDPSQNLEEKMDVYIEDGKIQDVAVRISTASADEVIDLTNQFVTPGLIDLHAHVAEKVTPYLGVNADHNCLRRGTTTSVDAGSTGELTFHAFRDYVISNRKSNILAFLNPESIGMLDYPPDVSGEKWPELVTASDEKYYDMFTNTANIRRVLKENRDIIVGLKWAHRGPESFRKVRELADRIGTMVMFENHHMPESLKHVKSGDVLTHIFQNKLNKVAGRIDGMMGDDGSLHEEFFDAYRRGVIFDVGHGRGSFSWELAEKAMKSGLVPHTISTDIWSVNVNGPVYDLPTTMSKLMYLGMSLQDVIKATTAVPSLVLKRKEIGTLYPGGAADISVLSLSSQGMDAVDAHGEKRKIRELLLPKMTFKDGVRFDPS